MLSNPPNFWDILHHYVMNGVFLHSLTLSLSGTSALILAFRGVESVAQRDVQTMVATHSVLRVLITATVHVYGLAATL